MKLFHFQPSIQSINLKRILYSNYKYLWMTIFLTLCVSTSLFLSIPPFSTAQESTTVSGRLIDTNGHPISDIIIYVRPYSSPNQNNTNESNESVQTTTDTKGGFTFTDIRHKALELDIVGDSKTGFEINVLSVEFGEIALYPNRGWHWSSTKFALDSGTKMENIIITADIRERSRIRTRVIYADGTPVSNTQIYVYRETRPFVGNNKGSSQLIKKTDDDGYFVEYLMGSDIPTHYITLAIEHHNLYAKAIPFILKDNTELVLKLNDTPRAYSDLPLEHSARFVALRTYLEPSPVWIVNPINGHAYKITHSQSITDAMDQAKNEEAYLVSINNEAEEKWLNSVFGNRRYWIGLSDAEEEGNWKWKSGEPLDYTNWGPNQEEYGNTETKDYVMVEPFAWYWEVSKDTYKHGNTQDQKPYLNRTILEKENPQPVTQNK